MSDRTLGELVDRLSICNLKLWFVQDKVHAAAREATGLDPETVSKLNDLNLERNRLMTAVDRCLADAVHSGDAMVDPRVKILHITGERE